MRYPLLAVCMLLAAAAQAAVPPPPQPPAVKISDVDAGPSRVSFMVNFTPSAGQTVYQFTSDPNGGCRFAGTSVGPSALPTATFTGPPYRVALNCECNHTFIANVAVAPDAAGRIPRSKWTRSAPVLMACRKP